jgi:cellulose synthase/poly-beta-1,6-N-acetylglucosamine synthase-like glycosyltransferase
VIVGIRTPGSAWRDAIRAFPSAKVVDVSGFPGGARNEVVEAAAGMLILFIDDDVTVQPEMLVRLAELMTRLPDVEIFGGPNATPIGSPFFEVVQGAVLASMVGAGPVRRRYGRHPAGPADERFFILCNLAVRKRSMKLFPPDLICAEENALLIEMKNRGLAMHYDPDLVVFHERRSNWKGFAQQMHKYGIGRGQVIESQPSTVRLAFILPAMLLVYLAVLPGLIFLTPWAAAPAVAYLAAVVISNVNIMLTLRKARALPLGILLTLLLHACYGAGVVRGVLFGKSLSDRRRLSEQRASDSRNGPERSSVAR